MSLCEVDVEGDIAISKLSLVSCSDKGSIDFKKSLENTLIVPQAEKGHNQGKNIPKKRLPKSTVTLLSYKVYPFDTMQYPETLSRPNKQPLKENTCLGKMKTGYDLAAPENVGLEKKTNQDQDQPAVNQPSAQALQEVGTRSKFECKECKKIIYRKKYRKHIKTCQEKYNPTNVQEN
jgi:hypothetical protein